MKNWLLIAFSMLFVIRAPAADPGSIENRIEQEPKMVFQLPLAGQPQVSVTELEDSVSAEDVAELIKSNSIQRSDILVTTDSEEVAKATLQLHVNEAQKHKDRKIRLMPFGPLDQFQSKFSEGLKTYYSNVKHLVQKDRLGLTILIVTTAYDSFLWIHSSNLSVHHKTSMVLMNLVLAASFGMDRNLWVNMTKPLRYSILSAIDRISSFSDERFDKAKLITSQFIANLAFGIGFQAVRNAFLSVGNFQDVVMSTAFWATSAKIGALMTITHFAWSELANTIDKEKNPIAKVNFDRFTDIRYLILSQVASLSMVFQPSVYGHSPVVAILIHSGIGLIALANSNRVIQFLETSPVSIQFYKSITWVENIIENMRESVTDVYFYVRDSFRQNSCRELFR